MTNFWNHFLLLFCFVAPQKDLFFQVLPLRFPPGTHPILQVSGSKVPVVGPVPHNGYLKSKPFQSYGATIFQLFICALKLRNVRSDIIRKYKYFFLFVVQTHLAASVGR